MLYQLSYRGFQGKGTSGWWRVKVGAPDPRLWSIRGQGRSRRPGVGPHVKVLRCGKCRSRLKWIAAITEADVIARILAHLKLECAVRVPRPARPPPQAELAY